MVVAVLITPSIVRPQSSRLSLDVAGGPHIPVGTAASVSAMSAALSIGFVHRINGRVALITEFQAAGFAGGPPVERVNTTDIGFLRWSLGLELVLAPASGPWVLSARAGGGFSKIGTDPMIDPARPPRFIAKINDDVFTLFGGFQLARSFGGVAPFIRVQPEVYLLGSNLGELQALDDGVGEAGVLIGVPVQLGLRIGF